MAKQPVWLKPTKVKIYGKCDLTIDIGLSQREMEWSFIVAITATAIIGADFLSYYKLAIDVGTKRLIKTEKSNVLNLLSLNLKCYMRPHVKY